MRGLFISVITNMISSPLYHLTLSGDVSPGRQTDMCGETTEDASTAKLLQDQIPVTTLLQRVAYADSTHHVTTTTGQWRIGVLTAGSGAVLSLSMECHRPPLYTHLCVVAGVYN